jgi:hypothetical protein
VAQQISGDSPQIRPEKLAYLKATAKEYFQDPRNKERLDQVKSGGYQVETGNKAQVA